MIYSLGSASTFYHFATDGAQSLHSTFQLKPLNQNQQNIASASFEEFSSSQSQVHLKASLCGKFFAVISPLSITIFSSGQRRVPLCRLQRSKSTLEFGLHSRAVWSVDGSRLFVCTTTGHNVCIYRFGKDQKKPLEEDESGYPKSIVGVGESPDVVYSDLDIADDDDDDGGDDSDGGMSGTRHQGLRSGSGVRPARKKLMVLSERNVMKKTRQLTFAAVLRLPYAVSDIALSLESLIFSCKSKPTIFTTQQARPRQIIEVIELEAFVHSDGRSWLAPEVPSFSFTTTTPTTTATTPIEIVETELSDFRTKHFLYARLTRAPSLVLHLKAREESGDNFTLPTDKSNSKPLKQNTDENLVNGPERKIIHKYKADARLRRVPLGVRQLELNESLDLLAVVMTSGAAAMFSWKQPFCASAASDFSLIRKIEKNEESSPIYTSSTSAMWGPEGFLRLPPDNNHQIHYDESMSIGICLRASGVSMIKMNRPKRIAAVAMLSGPIDLISLAGIYDARSFKRIRSINPCDALSLTLPLNALGELTCLRWSGDGLALVASWSKVGPVVFTHTGIPIFAPFRRSEPASPFVRFGNSGKSLGSHFTGDKSDRRKFSLEFSDDGSISRRNGYSFEAFKTPYPQGDSPNRTWPLEGVLIDTTHVGGPGSFNRRSAAENSILCYRTTQQSFSVVQSGVLSAEWIAADLGLLVCYHIQPECLTEYKFYRNASLGVGSNCAAASGLPFGSTLPSRVLIGSSEFLISEGRLWSPETSTWSRIPLPPAIYTSQNWPLRLGVLNLTGEWLLTAGKWGVALYGTRLKRWRLFGNVQHERALYTEGLPIGWYSHSVFFACFRSTTGASGGKSLSASKSDALRSSAFEQAIRRKALHKSSLTLINDWDLVDPTTTYSVVFLDVECRLDIDTAVAKIPELEARPLKVFLFTSSDGFKPSIATAFGLNKQAKTASNTESHTQSQINELRTETASIYNTASSLLADFTRPGAPYVDCHELGPTLQPQRNTIIPQQLSPMPILGIYDARRQLTAYRLAPPDHQPVVGGEGYGTLSNKKLTWEVEKLWKVDFKEAGWIDHPNDIRFVGSDHHLLIHHANGDVTGVTLSDPRPAISALFDARLSNRRSSLSQSIRVSPSISLTATARDVQNWSARDAITKNQNINCVLKNFTESTPLVSGVEMMWSTPQTQFPTFCPLPVPAIRAFYVSPHSICPYSGISSGSNSPRGMLYSKDTVESKSVYPTSHQVESLHTASLVAPSVSSETTPCQSPSLRLSGNSSTNNFTSIPMMTVEQQPSSPHISSRHVTRNVTGFVYPGPLIGVHSCTVVHHAQPSLGNPEINDSGVGTNASSNRNSQTSQCINGKKNSPGIMETPLDETSMQSISSATGSHNIDQYPAENRVTQVYNPQYLPLLSGTTTPVSATGKARHGSLIHTSSAVTSQKNGQKISAHQRKRSSSVPCSSPQNIPIPLICVVNNGGNYKTSSDQNYPTFDTPSQTGKIPSNNAQRENTDTDTQTCLKDRHLKINSSLNSITTSPSSKQPLPVNVANNPLPSSPSSIGQCFSTMESLHVSKAFGRSSRKLADGLKSLCNFNFANDLNISEDFWNDLRRETPGLYIWCETAEGLVCLTVSRQCSHFSQQPPKYIQTSNVGSIPHSHVKGRSVSSSGPDEPSYEGIDYRYRKMHLLRLDRRAPALKLFDVVASAGTVTGCYCLSLFDSFGPFSRYPVTQWKFEKLSFFHPVISSLLSLGPSPLPNCPDGYSLALQLCKALQGASQFPQILELLLHEALDDCVPLFDQAVKQYNNNPIATHQLFIKGVKSALRSPNTSRVRNENVAADTSASIVTSPKSPSIVESSNNTMTFLPPQQEVVRANSALSWRQSISLTLASLWSGGSFSTESSLGSSDNTLQLKKSMCTSPKPGSSVGFSLLQSSTMKGGDDFNDEVSSPRASLPTTIVNNLLTMEAQDSSGLEKSFLDDDMPSSYIIYLYCTVMYPAFRRLIRFLNLLKHFSKYYPHTIIAGIRKTEPLTTPSIVFPLLGLKPQELFDQCLQLGKLHDASLSLIVLQHLVGPSEVRRQYAIPLLAAALEASRFNIVKSIVGFFNSFYIINSTTNYPSSFLSFKHLASADSIDLQEQNKQLPSSSGREERGHHESRDTPHTAFWSPIALCPCGSAPPVVAGDADGVDKLLAEDSFIAFEGVILDTLVNCVIKCQWTRLICAVIALKLDLLKWLSCDVEHLRSYFERIESTEWEEFDMFSTSAEIPSKKNIDEHRLKDEVPLMEHIHLSAQQESSDSTGEAPPTGDNRHLPPVQKFKEYRKEIRHYNRPSKSDDDKVQLSFASLILSFQNQFHCNYRDVKLRYSKGQSGTSRKIELSPLTPLITLLGQISEAPRPSPTLRQSRCKTNSPPQVRRRLSFGLLSKRRSSSASPQTRLGIYDSSLNSIDMAPCSRPTGSPTSSSRTSWTLREPSPTPSRKSNSSSEPINQIPGVPGKEKPSADETSVFGFLSFTKSPQSSSFLPFGLLPPLTATGTEPHPFRLEALGSDSDKFLQYLFDVFIRLDIPAVAAAIAIASSDRETLSAVYRCCPAIQETIRRFTQNSLRRQSRLL